MSVNSLSNSRYHYPGISPKTVDNVFNKLDAAQKKMEDALNAEVQNPKAIYEAEKGLKQATQLVEALQAMQNMLSKLIDNIIDSLKRIGQ